MIMFCEFHMLLIQVRKMVDLRIMKCDELFCLLTLSHLISLLVLYHRFTSLIAARILSESISLKSSEQFSNLSLFSEGMCYLTVSRFLCNSDCKYSIS